MVERLIPACVSHVIVTILVSGRYPTHPRSARRTQTHPKDTHPSKEQHKSARRKEPVPKRVKRALLVLGLLASIVILFMAEGLLRLCGFGGYPPLAVKQTLPTSEEMFELNKDFCARYFDRERVKRDLDADAPTFYLQQFLQDKPDGVFRVFSLGDSTAMGFPENPFAAYTDFLRLMMEDTDPGRRYEFVNLGVTALNSWCIADMAEEAVQYHPDLLIVYTGHNEYYGVMRGGAWLPPEWTYFVRSLAIHQAIDRLILALTPKPKEQSTKTLMGVLGRERTVPPHSKERERSRKRYEQNIRRLIQIAQSNNIPIVFVKPVANLSEHRPFASVSEETLPAEQKQQFRAHLTEGLKAENQKDWTAAEKDYSEAVKMLPDCAHAHYELGRVLQNAGRKEDALSEYVEARDLDMIPFRAPSAILKTLTQVCQESQVPCVDADPDFMAASATGLPGLDLFWEHVHPKRIGHVILAEAILKEIKQSNIQPVAGAINMASLESRLDYVNRCEAGEIWLEWANFNVPLMRTRWPFNEPMPKSIPPIVDEDAIQKCRQILEGKMPFLQAVLERNVQNRNKGEYETARLGSLGIWRTTHNPACLFDMALTAVCRGDEEEGLRLFREYRLWPPDTGLTEADFWNEAAVNVCRANDLVRGEKLYNRALEADQNNIKALLNLGILKERNHDLEAAQGFWKRVLEIDPDNVNAKQNLAKTGGS